MDIEFGVFVEFDPKAKEGVDLQDLVRVNKSIILDLIPDVKTVRLISGKDVFIVNELEYIQVGDDHLSRLGIKGAPVQ